MTTKLIYKRSKRTDNSYIYAQSDTIYAVVLAAGVAQQISVPAMSEIAVFSADAPYYMKCDGTAAIPSTTVTDGSASELNPAVTVVRDVAMMSFISETACVVTVMFYT